MGSRMQTNLLGFLATGDAGRLHAARAKTSRGDGAHRSPDRRKPVCGPFPAHLPREWVVIAGPAACPCCHGKLAKLGEDVTETLEAVPRSWKVVQTVRERFTCRTCETISQAPAPFHVIARGRAGPSLLAMILEAKYGQHLPLNRQSETYAREGIELDVSTMADWVGATLHLGPRFGRLPVVANRRRMNSGEAGRLSDRTCDWQ